jgi:hypothetical protein
VVGRALAFADPEIIRLARDEYIAVAGDDWYQRRRQDAEGKFFRSVADQGPRKGIGGSTRQGIYLFTANGKLLNFRNSQDPTVMRDVLRLGLKRWKELPAEQRKAGAVKVPSLGKTDPRYTRTPPKDGLIVNVYTRILDHDSRGGLCKGGCKMKGADQAAHDHLWLTGADWKALLPARAKVDSTFAMPAHLVRRIVRFHLLDNTRGEPPYWQKEHVRSSKMTLTVEEASSAGIRLRLDGSALLTTNAETAKASRGYDVRLLGYIHYNAKSKKIDRFNIVAVGDHWGEGHYTRGARPGRKPLGIAFELARGDTAADRVPPQAARDIGGYLSRTE